MATALRIVDRLIARGDIPAEYRKQAAIELSCELEKRSRRVALGIARVASHLQGRLRLVHSLAR